MSEPDTEEPAVRTWRDAWLTYAQPRMAAMLCLGFSAGLPFLLVFSTLSAWLTEAGATRTAIGLFSWRIHHSIKVLRACVDRLQLRLPPGLVGAGRDPPVDHRRPAGGHGVDRPRASPRADAAGGPRRAPVAFGSATQDVAIDAWRIEAAPPEQQAAMAASYVFGYRMALLAGGAGALHIATFLSWPGVYVCMAALMAVGMLAVLASREPGARVPRETVFLEQRVQDFMTRNAHLPERLRLTLGWLIGAVVCPFVDFFARNGRLALMILLFIGLYRVTDITMGVMANPFYLDLGFSKAQIANVSGIYGIAMTIVGGVLGGVLVPRFGVMRVLLAGSILAAVTNLLFAALALLGPELWMLVVTISADNLAGGLAISAFIAYLSGLTNTAYTATQYALFSSLMTLPGKVIGGAAGAVVDALGYPLFFVYSAVIGVPAMLLVVYLMWAAPVDEAAISRESS
ncbi:MAG: MFS transporter [Gammaproteobacteria bacterium]|nr:MFS transporter [Gammaproteobacteria bacterium]